MSVTDEGIRAQAAEYLHQVAHHDDTNYGNVFVIDGARIDGDTALDMAELALRTGKPIATAPAVTVAQALELARRIAALEDRLSPAEMAATVVKQAVKQQRAKAGSGEAAQA